MMTRRAAPRNREGLPRNEDAGRTPTAMGRRASGTDNVSMELRRNVLVVDDNEIVRDLTGAMLERAGFVVHAATTSTQALDLAATLDHIDLLVTDVIMPGMNGIALADLLVERHPEVSVLFTSGQVDDRILAPGSAPHGAAFLPKPFTMAELVKTAQEVFEAGQAIAGHTVAV
jgi:CheY-like chemotaxis protein